MFALVLIMSIILMFQKSLCSCLYSPHFNGVANGIDDSHKITLANHNPSLYHTLVVSFCAFPAADHQPLQKELYYSL